MIGKILERPSRDVFQAVGGVIAASAQDIALVADAAKASARRRARLCAHPQAEDKLHEMLIVLAHGTYIRPHRHAGKSESFHIIEGRLDIVIFTAGGTLQQVVRMGPYDSGLPFYYRLQEPAYHSVLVRTARVLFHETTNGPFVPGGTEFAPWAPAEGTVEADVYLDTLAAHLDTLAAQTSMETA